MVSTTKNITKTDFDLLHNFLALGGPLHASLFSTLKKHVQKRSFKKGEAILKAGDTEVYANIVVKGVVLQYIYDEDVPKTVNITPVGLCFNALKSYLEEVPSNEIHEAITDVEILSLKKTDLERLAQEHHEFSYQMFKVYENILLDRENRMFVLQHRSPAKRFSLFHDIIERAHWMLEDTPDKYIASYLNMTPQQYSKEKKKHLASIATTTL